MNYVKVCLRPWLMGMLCLLMTQFLPAQSQGTPVMNFSTAFYQISPLANGHACMDASGDQTANGTKLQTYSCNGTNAQMWSLSPVVTAVGSGYQLMMKGGACVDLKNHAPSNGSLLQEWQCYGATQLSQVWQFIPFGSSFELQSLSSGQCLDLSAGDSGDGTQLQQWDCGSGGNPNQLWNLKKMSPEGVPQLTLAAGPYQIDPVVDSSICADVAGASIANGAAVRAFRCNGTKAQSWSLVPVQSNQGPGYNLVAGSSGACLDLLGGTAADGVPTGQWQCLGMQQLSQVWQLMPFGDAYEVVSLNTGKCLDLQSGNTADGTPLQQWSCGHGSNLHQLWTLRAGTVATAPPKTPAPPATQAPGTAAVVAITSTTILANPSSAVTGQTVTLSGQVTSSTGTPSGVLSFYQNGVLLGSSAVDGKGEATLNVAGLGNGSYAMGAQFQGLPLYAASSATAAVTVTASSVGQQAGAADAFVDSVGVQTHLNYLPTPYYKQWPLMFQKLKESGIRHIRDGYVDSEPFLAEHQQLAAAGIGAMIGVPLDAATAPGFLQRYAQNAGDLDAIEAPNECDNGNNCGNGGYDGIANVAKFLYTLSASGKSLNVPVVGPSFVSPLSYGISPNLSDRISYSNVHLYFGGRNPGGEGWGGGDKQGHRYGSFPFWLDIANEDAPGLPLFLTETGYISYPTTSIPYTIPESVEANYKTRLLLLAYNYGVKRTYLYEFIDQLAEPGYGLLHNDLSEKAAFTAIKGMNKLLADPGPAFSPGKLDYTLTGGDSTVNTTLMQKRDGSFWLAIWLEQSGYDPATNTFTPVSTQNVTLSLNGPAVARTVYQLDTAGNISRSALKKAAQTVSLSVTDSVMIVQITPP